MIVLTRSRASIENQAIQAIKDAVGRDGRHPARGGFRHQHIPTVAELLGLGPRYW